jgi:hypothetical protein
MHKSSVTVSSERTSILEPVSITLAIRCDVMIVICHVLKVTGRSRILHTKETGYITRSGACKIRWQKKRRDNRLIVFPDGSGQLQFAVSLVMSPIARVMPQQLP